MKCKLKYIHRADEMPGEETHAVFNILDGNNQVGLLSVIIDSDVENQNESGDMPFEDWVKFVVYYLDIKSGTIYFVNNHLNISVINSKGHHLFVQQDGEFNMYGGPYKPSFKQPTILLDGKDKLSEAQAAFDEYDWTMDTVDLQRIDIWAFKVLNS